MLGRSVAVLGFLAAMAPLGAEADTAAPGDPAVTRTVEEQHGVYLSDGQQAVLRIGAKGRLTVVSRADGVSADIPPPSNDTKVESLFHVQSNPLTAGPETLVATFKSFPGRGVVLKVENGFDHPVIYDAWTVTRRGDAYSVARTSVCPIRAHLGDFESWGPNVTAVVISNAREPPGDDLHCSGDSGLVNSAVANPNVCRGGDGGPIEVDLSVDPASGEPVRADAVWTPHPSDKTPMPQIRLYFPLINGVVAGNPVNAAVGAMVATDKRRPKASSAAIALIADGVEAARRPWRMYASQMASLEQALATAPPGRRPVGFFGVVPFSMRGVDGAPDPNLERLFTAIGAGKVRQLTVRVEGDDGSVIEQAVFDLSPAEIRDNGKVLAALHQAETLSRAPDHCRPQAAPKQQPG